MNLANPNPQTKGGKPDKLMRDALMAAIRQSPEKLKRGAEALLDKVELGDNDAWKFVAERIDGKVAQPIAGDDENPLQLVVTQIQRMIVDPALRGNGAHDCIENNDAASVPAVIESGTV